MTSFIEIKSNNMYYTDIHNDGKRIQNKNKGCLVVCVIHHTGNISFFLKKPIKSSFGSSEQHKRSLKSVEDY